LIAIIVVELVCVYVLWKPVRSHFTPQRHAALNSPVEHPAQKRQPEIRQPEVRQREIEPSTTKVAPRKPSGAIAHFQLPVRRKSLVVNAGLKTPEPIPATRPAPSSPPSPSPSSFTDSFWCRISGVESTCDCKAKEGDQAATLVTR
jgi:hypothetical protein